MIMNHDRLHAILYLSISTESLSRARTDKGSLAMYVCAQAFYLYWLSLTLTGMLGWYLSSCYKLYYDS